MVRVFGASNKFAKFLISMDKFFPTQTGYLKVDPLKPRVRVGRDEANH